MRNPSKTLLGLALSSALLAGCGGGGSSTSPAGSGLDVRGGATMTSETITTAIPASGTPQSASFNGTTAMVPAGITIPANTPIAIVGTSTPVLGLQGSGPFSVNGAATGITLTNGSLSSSVALPPTTGGAPYAIAATAPAGGFVIPGTRSLARDLSGLTINGTFVLGVPVLANGTAGFPTNVTGTVPTNGSTSANVSLTVTYPAAFAGYRTRLVVSWNDGKSSQTLDQTRTVAQNGKATFTMKSAHTIPATGVDTVGLYLDASNI